MTSHSKYKPGDRVVALRWPRDGAGVVVKSAPVHSLVRWDGRAEDTRARTADFRAETAEDIGRRHYEQKLQAWQYRKPRLEHVQCFVMPLRGGPLVDNVQVLSVRTPETMREAAAELLQLADWFADKPEKSCPAQQANTINPKDEP